MQYIAQHDPWQPYEKRPPKSVVPEPEFYGFSLILLTLAAYTYVRKKRTKHE
jgi:hypothetical protein